MHACIVAMAIFHELVCELLPRPLYSPDLTPSDHFLLKYSTKKWLGQKRLVFNFEIISLKQTNILRTSMISMQNDITRYVKKFVIFLIEKAFWLKWKPVVKNLICAKNRIIFFWLTPGRYAEHFCNILADYFGTPNHDKHSLRCRKKKNCHHFVDFPFTGLCIDSKCYFLCFSAGRPTFSFKCVRMGSLDTLYMVMLSYKVRRTLSFVDIREPINISNLNLFHLSNVGIFWCSIHIEQWLR